MRKHNNIKYVIENEELRKLAVGYFKEKLAQINFEGFQDSDSNEINSLTASISVYVDERVK